MDGEDVGVMETGAGVFVIVSKVCVMEVLGILGGRFQALGFGESLSVSGCFIVVVFTRSVMSVAPQGVIDMLGKTSRLLLSGCSLISFSSSRRMFST